MDKTESLNEPKLNPLHRIRDGVRYGRPKSVLPYATWQAILDNAARAAMFLDEDNPIYVSMWNELRETENAILTNKIGEEREESVLGAVRQIFIKEKKQNIDEAVGRFKYLRKFFSELKSWIDAKAQTEKDEADGLIVIERKEQDAGPEAV